MQKKAPGKKEIEGAQQSPSCPEKIKGAPWRKVKSTVHNAGITFSRRLYDGHSA